MQKEKEEEDCRRTLKEREEYLKKQKGQDKLIMKQIEKKRQLKQCLEKQIQEAKKREEESEKLKEEAEEETRHQLQITKLEEKYHEEEKLRMERDAALCKFKQHKLKLKRKLESVQQKLKQDQELIARLREMDSAERIQNLEKKTEVKNAIIQFEKITEEQQKLEEIRQRDLEFCFDSEAKVILERQNDIWKQEELSRQRLLEDVLDTIKIETGGNMVRNNEKQIEVLKERIKLLKEVEEYYKEMEDLMKQEEQRQRDFKQVLDPDIKLKHAEEKQQENIRLKELDENIEKIRKEEERLRREINIQKRHVPVRRIRSNIF